MSAESNNNALPSEALVQASAVVANAIRVAKAAQDMASKAPKAADAAEIEKAASLLQSHGYITADRLDEARRMLADPTTAVKALQNVILKSASAQADPRLASGRPTPASPTNRLTGPLMKQSSDEDFESEADREYNAKVANYRSMNGTGR